MEKVSDMIWVGILAVLMGGCGLLGGGDRKPNTTNSPTATPTLTPKKAAAKSKPKPKPEETVEPLPSAPDLIPSTNAEQRIREIEQSEGQQRDPFNVVRPRIVELPKAPRTIRNPIDRTPIRQLPGVPRITPSTPDAIASGNGVTTGGEVPPRLEPIAPARAETATAVTVSGVMELGGERSAIVTAPDEPSRHVKVGDILASGAVLVKRIEISRFDKPVVILEENGYEVARELGEKPSSEEQP
ncbi:MAG: hypothetical protein GDA56_27170 [Hormoscilla sp. GM7CHS1pb]|nr:hypothetical protein [Hormoscilla sp. GM7CHS1pb]